MSEPFAEDTALVIRRGPDQFETAINRAIDDLRSVAAGLELRRLEAYEVVRLRELVKFLERLWNRA